MRNRFCTDARMALAPEPKYYANAHYANADRRSRLHMRCAWRELAFHIDLWHRPAFFTLFFLLLVASVTSITLAEGCRHNQWLRRQNASRPDGVRPSGV